MKSIRALLLVMVWAATGLALTPPQKSEPNQQVPATPQANAGPQSATTPATAPPSAGASNPTLQGQIQQALQNESGLDASHIAVSVTDNSIEISGSVPSSEDKKTAQRIAQSFDGNRKFNDSLTVTGQAVPAGAGSSAHPTDSASSPKSR